MNEWSPEAVAEHPLGKPIEVKLTNVKALFPREKVACSILKLAPNLQSGSAMKVETKSERAWTEGKVSDLSIWKSASKSIN